jgi:hypothetical protein
VAKRAHSPFAVAQGYVAPLLLVVALGCARRGPPPPTGLAGETEASGIAEATLRFRPPPGARTVCPAYLETLIQAVGADRPVQQTLGGERQDVEYVEAASGTQRMVRRTFGGTKWTTSYPLPAPETRDLPPTESLLNIDERGKVVSGTADKSITAGLAAWVRLFDVLPGWPDGALRPGDVVPRPVLGPGPPGTQSTVRAAAPLTLVGFVRLGGRTCAKLRSDVSGWLSFPPPNTSSAGPPAQSVLRGTGWLYIDVETGMLLGSLHQLHYGLPLPAGGKTTPLPEFRVTFRSGPCTYEAGAM